MPEKPVREHDKFMLRLPDGMRDEIAAEAKTHGRSMNTEIVLRLRRSLDQGDLMTDLAAQLNRIEAAVRKVDRKIKTRRDD